MSRSKILFILTGSIACYKACQVISKLSQKGHQVQVVATPAALKFIGNATIEGLTGRPVVSDLFAAGNVMDHIHLVRWADLVIAAPATAHYMNRMAAGIADDLATTLFLAHDFKKPFLVAPAMNTAMYQHPTTKSTLEKLKGMGVQILDSSSGALACGETGYGRLLEPEQILEVIEKNLPNESTSFPKADRPFSGDSTKPIRILITAGGTQEHIDDVRVLTNVSTGQTGYKLALHLLEAGYEVEILRAENSRIPQILDFPSSTFTDYKSLDFQLQRLLSEGRFTHVIHAAAVSDYSVFGIFAGAEKINSSGKIDSSQEISIQLKPNPKILSRLKSYSKGADLKVIAFKLTSHLPSDQAFKKVEKLLQDADYVVHNDTKDIDKSAQKHKFTLWDIKSSQEFENVEQLSAGISQMISTGVKS